MKKPVIITVAVVLVLAIAAVFAYPYFVERRVGDFIKEDFSDVVKVDLFDGSSFKETDVTDPDDIEYLADFVSNLTVKKSVKYLFPKEGGGLRLIFIKSNGDEIKFMFAGKLFINDSPYACDINSGSQNGNMYWAVKDRFIRPLPTPD